MQMATHRRALDDSEIEVWSATLGKRDSLNTSNILGKDEKQKDKFGFVSQNILPQQIEIEAQKQNSGKVLSSSDTVYMEARKKDE